MKKRYAVWGVDKTYRWLWLASLVAGIIAAKHRYYRIQIKESHIFISGDNAGSKDCYFNSEDREKKIRESCSIAAEQFLYSVSHEVALKGIKRCVFNARLEDE